MFGALIHNLQAQQSAGKLMTDFGKLVEAQIPSLRRYARALTRTSVEADDLVQECLVRAMDKQALFRPGTNLRAWLFTLMHNQHVNNVRRTIRDGSPVELDEALDAGRHSNAIPSLELRDLRAAIAKLPLEQREVVLLVGLEGLTYEAVAEIMSVPIGTIRSRLSRGRNELRVLMGIAEADDDRPGQVGQPPVRPRGARPVKRAIRRSQKTLNQELVA